MNLIIPLLPLFAPTPVILVSAMHTILDNTSDAYLGALYVLMRRLSTLVHVGVGDQFRVERREDDLEQRLKTKVWRFPVILQARHLYLRSPTFLPHAIEPEKIKFGHSPAMLSHIIKTGVCPPGGEAMLEAATQDMKDRLSLLDFWPITNTQERI